MLLQDPLNKVLHTTVGPVNVYKISIRGTDLVVFVLISFPQMSNVLLLKSVPLAQPQISNRIMCPYYPYVVLYHSGNTYFCVF